MNEILFFISIVVSFLIIIAAYRVFGKTGLLIWIPVSTIIANIEVIQTIKLFGLVATLGNVTYATSFLVTDILSEVYGKKSAAQAVWIGFFSLIAMTLLMNMALLFQPLAGDTWAEQTHQSMTNIFSIMPRIAFASLLAYLVSQHHDVWSFHFWKDKYPGKKWLWLRNNFSTMISQLIDSLIFTLVAFWGIYEGQVLWEILLTTYFLKVLVAMADTPFVYWATHLFENGKIRSGLDEE